MNSESPPVWFIIIILFLWLVTSISDMIADDLIRSRFKKLEQRIEQLESINKLPAEEPVPSRGA